MTTIYTTRPLPARRAHDHYPTERSLIRAALERYALQKGGAPELILDPGAGDGRWGWAAKVLYRRAEVHGIELRHVPRPVGFDSWWGGHDFLTEFSPGWSYDLIIGNPPYGPKIPEQRYSEEKGPHWASVPLAEHFIKKSFRLLAPGGRMIYLLPLQLQAGKDRYNNLWVTHPPSLVAVVASRPSFGLNAKGRRGTNGTDYGLFIWDKTLDGACAGTARRWVTELFNYEIDSQMSDNCQKGDR